jgi:transposase
MSEVAIIGIDLAKRVSQLHGARDDRSVVFRKKLSRGQVLVFFAEQPQLHCCHGGLRQSPRLGTRTREAWPLCALDPASLYEAVRKAPEE